MVHTCLFSWQASNLIIKGRRLWDPLRAGLAEPGAGGVGWCCCVWLSPIFFFLCWGGLLIIPLLKMAWDLNSVSLQCGLQVCTFTEKCRPVVSQAAVFSLLRHKHFPRALEMWRVVVSSWSYFWSSVTFRGDFNRVTGLVLNDLVLCALVL